MPHFLMCLSRSSVKRVSCWLCVVAARMGYILNTNSSKVFLFSPSWFWGKLQRVPGPPSRTSLLLSRCCAYLLTATLYALAAMLSDFLQHLFITQYRYTYPASLVLAQVLLTLLVLQTLRCLGCVPLRSYSLRLGELLLVPSLCSSFHTVLGLWAVGNAPSGLFNLTQRLVPIACLAWTRGLGTQRPPSVRVSLLVTGISLGSLLPGIQSTHSEDSLVYLYAPLSLFLESLYLCWLQKVWEQLASGIGNISMLDIHYTVTVNSSLVLGFFCLLQLDSPQALIQGSWHSLLFLGYLVGLLALGSIVRLLLCVTALRSSAVTSAVMEVAKVDLVTLRSLVQCSLGSTSSPVLTSFFFSTSGLLVYCYQLALNQTHLV
ncbi:uncharacterized protein si:ch211-248a14.8 isoform X1 [Acipenser ruthenus]|uniref:uncharacterized protein si:ch211-248a14.8 isoform X1 n=2 Tax=Acipenser ruthenus TaxID=7906 RepID=UPI0027428BF9|nr:uncharacterized protein si:ch211-248a14.8 isoform X1 [Acipenser ruthenus]